MNERILLVLIALLCASEASAFRPRRFQRRFFNSFSPRPFRFYNPNLGFMPYRAFYGQVPYTPAYSTPPISEPSAPSASYSHPPAESHSAPAHGSTPSYSPSSATQHHSRPVAAPVYEHATADLRRAFFREATKADCLLMRGEVFVSLPIEEDKLPKAIQALRDLQDLIRSGEIADTNQTLINMSYFAKGGEPQIKFSEFAGTHYIHNLNVPNKEELRHYFSKVSFKDRAPREDELVVTEEEKRDRCEILLKLDVNQGFNFAGYEPAFRRDRDRIIKLLKEFAREGYRLKDSSIQEFYITDAFTKPYGNVSYELKTIDYKGKDARRTLNIPTGTTREELLELFTK